MKRTVKLTESELHHLVREAIENKMSDMVTDFNRYGEQLPSIYWTGENEDAPSDWNKATSWKLREPDVDDVDLYQTYPWNDKGLQKIQNRNLAAKFGHPINFKSDVVDKIKSEEQLNDPEFSAHNFTYGDDNAVYIRPSHWALTDDDVWKGVNEPSTEKNNKKNTKKDRFNSADKRMLHRKGSGNRDIMDIPTHKKLDEAITRAIRKLLK